MIQSIAQFDPNYDRDSIDNDLISRQVAIAQTNEEIGTVEDVLVDESGRFRYLVVSAGSWKSHHKFLLPIGRCQTNRGAETILLMDIPHKEALEELPPYHSDRAIDYDYEEKVRNIYRQILTTDDDSEMVSYDRDNYSYDSEPKLYQISAGENQTIKLYEERLITDKQRREVGEVTINKRVETETAQVEVPVEKEKVVLKRNQVAEDNIRATPGEATFEEGTVAQVKVYEETADIEKQAFVRENTPDDKRPATPKK